MLGIGKLLSSIRDMYKEVNPATLTGAVDVIVVQRQDGSLACSPFYVRFGKTGVLTSREKQVDITINDESIPLHMRLNHLGDAYFVEDASDRQVASKPDWVNYDWPMRHEHTVTKSSQQIAEPMVASFDGSEASLRIDDTMPLSNEITLHVWDGMTTLKNLNDHLFNLPEVSFEQFSNDPTMLFSSDVLFRWNNKYYRPTVALPILLSLILYRRQISYDVVSALIEKYQCESIVDFTSPLTIEPCVPNSQSLETRRHSLSPPLSPLIGTPPMDPAPSNNPTDIASLSSFVTVAATESVENIDSNSPSNNLTVFDLNSSFNDATVYHGAENGSDIAELADTTAIISEQSPIEENPADMTMMMITDSSVSSDNRQEQHYPSSSQPDTTSPTQAETCQPATELNIVSSSAATAQSSSYSMYSWFSWRRSQPSTRASTVDDATKRMSVVMEGNTEKVAQPPQYLSDDHLHSPPLSEEYDTLGDRRTGIDQKYDRGALSDSEIDVAYKRSSSVPKPKKTLYLSSDQLKKLNLKPGQANHAVFSVTTKYQGTSVCECDIYLWYWHDKIVVSDVDGTITKSDVLGHILPIVGFNWEHSNIVDLFNRVLDNGYRFLYLTARAVGQSHQTKDYLRSIVQNGKRLPDGPLLLSPTSLFTALHREVIEKKPEIFKIKCLRDVKSLFLENAEPFYAGFGNKSTDEVSYKHSGICSHRIFTINAQGEVRFAEKHLKSSYQHILDLADYIFPPLQPVLHRCSTRRRSSSQFVHDDASVGAKELKPFERSDTSKDGRGNPGIGFHYPELFSDYSFWHVEDACEIIDLSKFPPPEKTNSRKTTRKDPNPTKRIN